MKDYPKPPQIIAQGSTVLSTCSLPKLVDVPCEHVGACIVVHGVNDVGWASRPSRKASARASPSAWRGARASPTTLALHAAGYRMPTDDDRAASRTTRTRCSSSATSAPHPQPGDPVLLGLPGLPRRANRRRNGQWLDEAGNRLDKDLSKGGGPFANATTNLADMWKSGAPAFGGFIDWLSGDPLRPVLEGPGRMYFVLAAQRLAALVRMIRNYDANDTVNIVAHSQGCLIACWPRPS
jgi:hypothetical protein